jgi:hypothetical protein
VNLSKLSKDGNRASHSRTCPGFVMFSLGGSTRLFSILTSEFLTELVLVSSLRSERDCVSFTYTVKTLEASSKTRVEDGECVSVHINHT